MSDTSRRMPPSRESGEEMSRREPPPFPHLVALEPEPPARIEPMAATLEDRGRREESRPQTSPQTIQVTIGRIEVKATSPATRAPRPERKGAHVMSLDDYMRQRAGGGR